MITGVQLAQEDLRGQGQLSPMVERLLTNVLSESQRMARIVDTLLDIGISPNPDISLKCTPTTIEPLLRQVTGAVEGVLSVAEITLSIEIEPRLPDLMLDVALMQRVFVNLVDNAVRYTPVGGTIMVRARVDERSNAVLVSVADSGPGIPERERERVFERHAQVQNALPQRGAKGSGLGLTFCKRVVEAHGGNIWIEQQSPLPGACLTILLPIASMNSAVN
ncbi:MAG: HAMP domain-containing histidine kinase [Blastochloris sp.]|nr:HAMP domain-containing histidine kinase [Blastochloris sp.]